MSEIAKCADFFRSVNGTQLGTLADVDSPRLRMMLYTEVYHIRFQQFRSQLTVRSRNGTHETSGTLARSTTFIHSNVTGFSTEDNVIRTSHQLECHGITTCSIEYEQGIASIGKLFLDDLGGFFCPRVIAIAYGMTGIRFHQGLHYQWMYPRVIV